MAGSSGDTSILLVYRYPHPASSAASCPAFHPRRSPAHAPAGRLHQGVGGAETVRSAVQLPTHARPDLEERTLGPGFVVPDGRGVAGVGPHAELARRADREVVPERVVRTDPPFPEELVTVQPEAGHHARPVEPGATVVAPGGIGKVDRRGRTPAREEHRGVPARVDQPSARFHPVTSYRRPFHSPSRFTDPPFRGSHDSTTRLAAPCSYAYVSPSSSNRTASRQRSP